MKNNNCTKLHIWKIVTLLFVMMLLPSICACKGRNKTVYPLEIVPKEEAEITSTEKENSEIIINMDKYLEDKSSSSSEIVVEIAPSESMDEREEEEIPVTEDENGNPLTPDGKRIIDLIIFMGQSNMSGVGGNVNLAPPVDEGKGYEFKAISDPTRLYNIEEPFGKNESFIGGICDFPGSKRGSIVSSFINEYYEQTHTPVVCVSASEGATTTEKWMSASYQADLSERFKRAVVWLESNNFSIRNRYAVWLQGESDAANNVEGAKYIENMDNIIRCLFIEGLNKVFIITPGRTITIKNYFDTIVKSQIEMCRKSGYYALATTALCKVSTEFMVDEWHYNQKVLNYIGKDTADSVAFYTLNRKEKVIYDYKNDTVYIPELFDYTGEETAEYVDINEVLRNEG